MPPLDFRAANNRATRGSRTVSSCFRGLGCGLAIVDDFGTVQVGKPCLLWGCLSMLPCCGGYFRALVRYDIRNNKGIAVRFFG
jgi:hypothetical protein